MVENCMHGDTIEFKETHMETVNGDVQLGHMYTSLGVSCIAPPGKSLYIIISSLS